jgi:hypothetical protein
VDLRSVVHEQLLGKRGAKAAATDTIRSNGPAARTDARLRLVETVAPVAAEHIERKSAPSG